MPHPIIVLLIFASGIAFFYKVYLHDKLDGKQSSHAFLGLGRRIFAPKYLFPIRMGNYTTKDIGLIKSANRALAVFWICFLLAIIFGAVDALI
ncbi:hypothetical protein OCK74_27870 [Chitinophagaceae bacterium LB-8]|uniref:Uncharacterized protein n=1 Tax=Paraflavisolibacter caeni TaxID=2982496 RepID=A0A9X2Y2S3_9BACT|nr:hypothetical protein [Paraflavisolibacter caeni]MCU7552963.1 hypothetical protein [Paraflavisolibacter caeni]